jgi:hypothetical protein
MGGRTDSALKIGRGLVPTSNLLLALKLPPDIVITEMAAAGFIDIICVFLVLKIMIRLCEAN